MCEETGQHSVVRFQLDKVEIHLDYGRGEFGLNLLSRKEDFLSVITMELVH